MYTPPAPPGWYPDPAVPGAQRYFDGTAWTGHVVPPPPAAIPPWGPMPYGAGPAPWGMVPTWKGAKYGRPAQGPGSLASPGRRLGARLLDGLVLLPVVLAIEIPALIYAIHRLHHFFVHITLTRQPNHPNVTVSTLFSVYPVILGAGLLVALVTIAYEGIMTATRGHTLGKQALGIRPIRTDGQALGWGRSIARPALYALAGVVFSAAAILDVLWCLWDADSQCLHDKVVDSLVVVDGVLGAGPG